MNQFQKHLTLHLYRKDEVLGALRWSLINHNISESIYWGLELFDSDMEEDILQMLESIWITELGFGSISVLSRILDIYKTGELDRDTLITILNCISRIKPRDSTILYLLIRGATTPITWSPKFHHSLTYTTIQESVKDTLSRGKVLDAWLLARAISSDDQWIILTTLAIQCDRHEFLRQLQESNLSDDLQRVIAFGVVSLQNAIWDKANEALDDHELPSEIKESIDEWDAEESLRKRRVYKIRPEALLYITERSEQSQLISSEPDIQENLVQTLLESPYWIDVLSQYMTDGAWISDSYKEMFYTTYFSSDIPDEWSSSDREKSHGRGLGRSHEGGFKRFIDTLFERSKSLEIWNYVKPDTYIDILDWNTIYNDLREKCLLHLEPQFPLRAKMKVFEIVT